MKIKHKDREIHVLTEHLPRLQLIEMTDKCDKCIGLNENCTPCNNDVEDGSKKCKLHQNQTEDDRDEIIKRHKEMQESRKKTDPKDSDSDSDADKKDKKEEKTKKDKKESDVDSEDEEDYKEYMKVCRQTFLNVK